MGSRGSTSAREKKDVSGNIRQMGLPKVVFRGKEAHEKDPDLDLPMFESSTWKLSQPETVIHYCRVLLNA